MSETFVPARGDLPAYTLRSSARAKRVRLNVSARQGLVVVVPRRLRNYDPTPILHERREWIAEATSRFADRRTALMMSAEAKLPSEIVFRATGEWWPVEYVHTSAATVSARVDGGAVVVRGAVDDADACIRALRRWLQRAADERLLALLAEHARHTGLSYSRATVRGQHARWGGCSASGAITLNRALLFLSPELVRSVVLHELAHLRQHNHSASFWRELAELDPEAHEHRAAIRASWDAVPSWAEPV